jgi:hypothetical protein
MINVTERAATVLQDLLTTNDAPPGQGVKLVPDSQGNLGMTIASPDEGDQVVRRDEAPLLIVDASIAQQLDRTELDVQEIPGEESAQFTLRPLDA